MSKNITITVDEQTANLLKKAVQKYAGELSHREAKEGRKIDAIDLLVSAQKQINEAIETTE